LTRTTELSDYSNILISVCRVQDLTPEYFRFKQILSGIRIHCGNIPRCKLMILLYTFDVGQPAD